LANKNKKNSKSVKKKGKRKIPKSSGAKKTKNTRALITQDTLKKALSLKEMVKYNYSADSLYKVKFKTEYIEFSKGHMELGLTLKDVSRKIGVHYSTFLEWTHRHPQLRNAVIEGQSEFIKSLGPKLENHMADGRSFESFAHICKRSKKWLYELVRIDEDFKDASERAYASSLYRWEDLLQAQAMGTLRRVSKEKIRTKKNGEPMIDPKTGEVLKDLEFVSTMGSDRALRLAMENRFEEYKKDKTGSESELFNELKDIMDANEREEMENLKSSDKKKNNDE